MKEYRIIVTAKEGIFNPAGATSKKALDNLGYTGINNVSIGKYIELSCDDSVSEATVAEMCDKLLANPVIEDYTIEDN